ncbi:MAG: YIP1 family protein [Deltaproteobacteria bacterium]|nr:YIP1 family protein [Deltaproteobacteria bacterium]
MQTDSSAASQAEKEDPGFCCKRNVLSLSCRVRDLVMNPRSVWGSILAEECSVRDLYSKFVALILCLPWVSWLIGKSFVGEHILFAGVVRWHFLRAFFAALFLYAFSMLLIYILAWVAKGLAAALGLELSFLRSSQLVSYSLVPAMVGGLLLVVPGLELIWGLVSFYGAYLLFEGSASLCLIPADKRVPFFLGVFFSALISFGMLGVLVATFAPPIVPKIFENAIGQV